MINGMNKRLVPIGLSIWALGGVPLMFFIYVEWSYHYALSKGKLPFSALPEWLWFLVFGLCLVSGLVSLFNLSVFQAKNRIFLGTLYTLVMSGILLAVHLFVACNNGDCI